MYLYTKVINVKVHKKSILNTRHLEVIKVQVHKTTMLCIRPAEKVKIQEHKKDQILYPSFNCISVGSALVVLRVIKADFQSSLTLLLMNEAYALRFWN